MELLYFFSSVLRAAARKTEEKIIEFRSTAGYYFETESFYQIVCVLSGVRLKSV